MSMARTQSKSSDSGAQFDNRSVNVASSGNPPCLLQQGRGLLKLLQST